MCSQHISIPQQNEQSRSPDLPLDVLDADLLAGLLVIVEPLAFSQVNTSERRTRFRTLGSPFALQVVR